MAHYAFLDSENIVTHVIVGRDEDDTDALPDGFDSWEAYYADRVGQTCKRTSYNTTGNQHDLGGTPFRANYAGVGYVYDAERDVFHAPQPFSSWTLNLTTFLWESPVPHPDDGKEYSWDEDALSWVLIPSPSE